MNKTELIQAVSDKSGITKKAASDAVEAVLATISDVLTEGEKVTLVGFGTFEVRDRAERKGINPSTREEITIPATKVPAFKPGKSLKEMVSK